MSYRNFDLEIYNQTLRDCYKRQIEAQTKADTYPYLAEAMGNVLGSFSEDGDREPLVDLSNAEITLFHFLDTYQPEDPENVGPIEETEALVNYILRVILSQDIFKQYRHWLDTLGESKTENHERRLEIALARSLQSVPSEKLESNDRWMLDLLNNQDISSNYDLAIELMWNLLEPERQKQLLEELEAFIEPNLAVAILDVLGGDEEVVSVKFHEDLTIGENIIYAIALMIDYLYELRLMNEEATPWDEIEWEEDDFEMIPPPEDELNSFEVDRLINITQKSIKMLMTLYSAYQNHQAGVPELREALSALQIPKVDGQ